MTDARTCILLCFLVIGQGFVLPVADCRGQSTEEPPNIIVHREAYDSPFQKTTRYSDLFDNIQHKLRKDLTDVANRLDVTLPSDVPIHVQLRAYDSEFKQAGMVTDTKEGHPKLILMPESFVPGRTPLDTVLYHEAVHLVFRLVLDPRLNAGLPKWFQEGVALVLANEGAYVIRPELIKSKDPKALLADLDEEVGFEDYPYCYLMLKFAGSKYRGTIDSLVRTVLNKYRDKHKTRSVLDVLTSAIGMTPEAFRKKGKKYALRQIKTHAGGLDTFRNALEPFQNENYETAISRFASVREKHPKSVFGMHALYYLGIIHRRQKNFQKTVDHMNTFIESTANSGYLDSAYLFRGLGHFGNGDYEKAENAFQKMTLYFPYANKWGMGRFYYGRSLEEQGRDREAKRVYKNLLEDDRLSEKGRKKTKERLENLD